MRAVLPAAARALLEPQVGDLDVIWFSDEAEATQGIGDAAIAWVDMHDKAAMARVIAAAGDDLRWLTTIYTGLDGFPLGALDGRGIVLTNGAGINAQAVAEYAVMGVLVAAKRFDTVLRAQDRACWLDEPPGRTELLDSRALVIGYGAIGRLIGTALAALGVSVVAVTRSGRDGTVDEHGWRAQLGTVDWVILAAPSTTGTRGMIGASELAAMKRSAWIVNVARGDLIDDAALVMALEQGAIGGAFLDPTHPEPLPPHHPLWRAPNALVTMHLSGKSQTGMFARAARLFLDNLGRFRRGEPLANTVDLQAGY